MSKQDSDKDIKKYLDSLEEDFKNTVFPPYPVDKSKEEQVCPHCGRCPTCGRRYYEPYWRLPNYYYYETQTVPFWREWQTIC